MPDEVELTHRERATILAALRFWREEMLPNGEDVIWPYFEEPGDDPLTEPELELLCRRLRQ